MRVQQLFGNSTSHDENEVVHRFICFARWTNRMTKLCRCRDMTARSKMGANIIFVTRHDGTHVPFLPGSSVFVGEFFWVTW